MHVLDNVPAMSDSESCLLIDRLKLFFGYKLIFFFHIYSTFCLVEICSK